MLPLHGLLVRTNDIRQRHGGDQQRAQDQQYDLRVDVALAEADAQADDGESGDDAAHQIALAAGGRNAAEDAHGDGVHFETGTGGGVRAIGRCNHVNGAQTCGKTHHRIDDKADLLFGIKNEVDFVAASFVLQKQDIADMYFVKNMIPWKRCFWFLL